MKKYFLYPGCSLEASASHYLISVKAMAPSLGIEWVEINDWNCCGASVSYVGASELQVAVLNARNLALAEAAGGYDIVAPCSSCYVIENKINRELKADPEFMAQVNEILAEDGLNYHGSLEVRHLLDVLYNDVGLDAVKQAVKRPLTGLQVAGYVGCQTTRPFGEYDSVENPHVMDDLLAALGATVVDFNKKMQCCGSGLFLTEMDRSMPLVREILEDAEAHGANVVSTACPMCQMNLEIYQDKINKALGTHFNRPIVFISQLMAVAFGLDPVQAGALNRNIVPAQGVIMDALKSAAVKAAKPAAEPVVIGKLTPQQKYQAFLDLTMAGDDEQAVYNTMKKYLLDKDQVAQIKKTIKEAALDRLSD